MTDGHSDDNTPPPPTSHPPGIFSPNRDEPTSFISRPPENQDWKEKLRALLEKMGGGKWAQSLGSRIQHFEPAQAVEWANRTFQRQDAGIYGKAVTIGLCTYFLADLSALLLGRYVPEPPISHLARVGGPSHRMRTIDDYNVVFTRNLFSSQGIIPGEDAPSDSNGPDQHGEPVRTTLPLNLVGTLILRDELRSIATIEDKSASMVYPVRVQDEIPSKARIIKIESHKVIFVNTSNGRREFVDLPEDPIGNNPRISVGNTGGRGGPAIEQVSANQYNINRSEVDKTLSDLNNVLTQARAVPNFENGVPNGYKLFQIVPGSIYDKLGLKNGDVIAGLNGQPINDPGKAFEMLSELKTANHLELQVKKDGKTQTNSYDIR